MQGSKKRIATAKHPTIEAVLNGMFRFEKAEQAIQRMSAIREFFVISKEQPDHEPAIRMWIKGFSLTEDEQKEGYIGNFAIIRPRKVGDGKYTLYAEKDTIPLKLHPQKLRPKRKHPDWGHPILRSIRKKTMFPSVEEAQALLLKMHEEYPEISIPVTGKLYIIIYTRTHKPPVQKFVLEIMVGDKGGFYIDCRENTYESTQKAIAAAEKGETKPADPAFEGAAPGYFASMVELKRSKKKRASPLKQAQQKKVPAAPKKPDSE